MNKNKEKTPILVLDCKEISKYTNEIALRCYAGLCASDFNVRSLNSFTNLRF